ncbi:LysR family transcriptional regulator [Actinoplanes friuliensis]|uniref:LysR family transcriptional regulator n=1 Tax=Actinoplanes friuliensis DSM 7358 TaxID=1246995 RepID=U5W3I0_9ACTN|nr:LysR family transcriptional regulator [Actinoplanes friuliensis]AGZ42496.1 LysR family transcriptional regulator [Actinoplanes friuliensis DSM 7358]
MDTRRLRLLVELSRLGSMREVAEEVHVTTSTVSQQLAVLAREAGATLIEPQGRRVRLTPAGRRLAEHAVTILAAVEAARLDLDPDAEPAGELRVAGFATAVRRSLLPIAAGLSTTHPRVRLLIHEHEPFEAFELLATDLMDLALTYDYNLAPAAFDPALETMPLWEVPWGLGVPAGTADTAFGAFRDHDWIVNSRNTADEDVVRTVASLEGFAPRIVHRADSLDLVQEMIVAGLGVGLLPRDEPTLPGVRVLTLSGPEVRLRSYAVTRRGRSAWPPLALVLRLLGEG